MAQAAKEIDTNALPVKGPAETLPIIRTETAAVLNMIERAARDPSVDIDKMRQLIELRRDAQREQAEEEFNDAMATVQSTMRAVAADANNSQTRSRYASYHALDKAIRPIYSAEGLALSFDTEDSPKPEHIRVVCYVTRGKHTRKYKTDMPADGKGAKGGDVMTKTHAAGAAFTYGQRYLLKMIFNIAIGDDDDGNAAGETGEMVNQDQLATLVKLADEVGADKEKFCRYMKVESFASIRASQFKRACDALNAKRRQT